MPNIWDEVKVRIFEKLSKVLDEVDLGKLEDDKKRYSACERARQAWGDLLTFDTIPSSLSVNNWRTVCTKIDAIVSGPAVEFQRKQREQHVVFVNKINALKALIKWYIVAKFNRLEVSGKMVPFNTTAASEEFKSAFDGANETVLGGAVDSAMRNGTTGASITNTLGSVLTQLTDNISAYLNQVYESSAKEIFKKYAHTYKALEKTKEFQTGNRKPSSLRPVSSSPTNVDMKAEFRLADAIKKLAALQNIAVDANGEESKEAELCTRLSEYLLSPN